MPSLSRLIAGLFVLVGSFLATGDGAFAQGRLEARYSATLGGVPIGRGAWEVVLSDNQFTAAATGVASGMLRLFTSGQGSSASRGFLSAGQFAPTDYLSTLTADKKMDEVRIAFGNGGVVKDLSVLPPIKPDPERIPLTEAHRRGVMDPMTAALTRVAGAGDPLQPASCQRHVPVFDGRVRYDLQTSFKRIDKVKADKGYAGPALVCSVRFVPIAGYIPDRAIVKYLTEQRDLEIWLAPIAGTRVVVPFRFDVPTPVGYGMLQATQFVVTAQPTAASAKTQ